MAVGTYLLVDLEASLKLPLVVFAERTRERPWHPRRRRCFPFIRENGCGRPDQCDGKRREGDGPSSGHDNRSCFGSDPKAGTEIDCGSGLVVSKSPSTGSTSRKNA